LNQNREELQLVGIKYDYNVDQYPVAKAFCDDYTNVHGIAAPNDIELMAKIVSAFKKVWDNLDQAMAHVDDEIYPGFDGALYETG
jgi:hypothetical protein